MEYRIYCHTEKTHVHFDAQALPTSCPTDPAHEVHHNKTIIILPSTQARLDTLEERLNDHLAL